MRYRKLDDNNDYRFGHGNNDFYQDTPEAVAQSVATRLRMLLGEWFLDTTDGTPWATEILGEQTRLTYDMAIRRRVLLAPGVTQITDYQSFNDGQTRHLSVNLAIDTVYGETAVREVV